MRLRTAVLRSVRKLRDRDALTPLAGFTRPFRCLAVAIVSPLLLVAGSASAVPTYELWGDNYSIFQSTPIDVDELWPGGCNVFACTYVDMYAGPGVLENGVSHTVQSNSAELQFNVGFTITDLVFSDTTGSGATTTSVSAVIDFSWLEGYFETADYFEGIDLSVNGLWGGWGTPVPHSTVGESGQIVSPTINDVVLGVPYTFGITLHWETGNVGGGTVSGLLRAQLADIPFILDEGITASSAEGNIVMNTFTPVPEPSTALLLAMGLVSLAWRRR